MEKIDILLWAVGGGFSLNFALLGVVWRSLNAKIDAVDVRLSSRMDKLDEKATDIDRRLCRLEGAFSSWSARPDKEVKQ